MEHRIALEESNHGVVHDMFGVRREVAPEGAAEEGETP